MSTSNDKNSYKVLSTQSLRAAYLITYSRANLDKFPTRQSFGDAVASAFRDAKGKVVPLQWACALETHKDGVSKHYHVSILLTAARRWNPVKEILKERHGIVVHFQENDAGYESAYEYLCKEDSEIYHSEGHKNIQQIGSPATKKAMNSYAERRRKRCSLEEEESAALSDACVPQPNDSTAPAPAQKKKTCRRLSCVEVTNFIIQNKIVDRIELLAAARQQAANGKLDLANYVLPKTPAQIEVLMTNSWDYDDCENQLAKRDRDRMHVMYDALTRDHAPGCEDDLWIKSARELLENNEIDKARFTSAIRALLVRGRGKTLNIMLHGEANCGKSFLLEPLTKIFDAFENPAKGKFAWMGAEKAEIILIDDFRWDPEQISWDDLLRLLEGKITKLPAPRNLSAHDVIIKKDTPILMTSRSMIRWPKKDKYEDRENDMMDIRWNYFKFFRKLTREEMNTNIPACPRCFAEFVLN